MSIHLKRALEGLNDKLITTASHGEEQLALALRAYTERDTTLAQQAIDSDLRLDELEVEVEEECLKILALHHPLSSDLRFIIAALKMNNDIERIGDHAVNIGKRALSLQALPDIEAPFDVQAMGKLARNMLRCSIDSLISTDLETAQGVFTLDTELNQFHRDNFNRISACIQKNPEQASLYFEYLSLSRYLERCGDLCKNIAEDVVYLIEGKIIRHGNA